MISPVLARFLCGMEMGRIADSLALIYPSGRRSESTPPQPNLSARPSFMSAEASELLWEKPQPSNANTTCSSQTTTEETADSLPGASAASAIEVGLECSEDSLLLDDWENEAQELSYTEPIPEAARRLMEARMAAPQGGLDASSASHSWEHPARVEKRKRVFSYEWVDRKTAEPPVGNFIIFKAPIFTVLKR